MQAATCFVRPFILSKSATKETLLASIKASCVKTRVACTKDASVAVECFTSVNYNSHFSVFPAEACEIVGGETCSANMHPETKLNTPQGSDNSTMTGAQGVDREYFDYSLEQSSVLRAEACDDLGGEFCDAPHM